MNSTRRVFPAFAALPGAILALVGVLPGFAIAGAWTEPQGGAYVRFAGAGIDTRDRFDSEGNRVAYDDGGAAGPVRYRDRELRLYAEYGLRDAVTLYGSATYKSVRTEQGTASSENVGVSDLGIAARVRVRGGGAPIALAVEALVPSGYSTTGSPTLGSGEAQITLRGLWGVGLGRAYATGDAGFTYRAGRYRNELVYSGEAGSRLMGPAYARVVARGVRAFGEPSGRPQGAVFDPGLTSPRSLELAATAGVDLGGGVSLEGGLTHALSGRDSLAGNSLELALVMAFGQGP